MLEARDDETVMNLVELARSQPPDQREKHLRAACSGDPELFAQAWDHLEWEDRMRGFLLDPLYEPPPEHRFKPDELLEARFRIVREVGEGGMGIVYESIDEKLGRRIAIKFAKTGFRKRLPPEVLHASEISHPNICRIFEIHTASTSDGEFDFLTMEFLDGETLAARLKRKPPSEAEARNIALQICQGLAEAHRNHVVHGDLKSNNIILTRAADGSERAVITDFGLARGPVAAFDESLSPTPGSSVVGGTPDYMAPELWKGGKPTAASDVYALGVILYELAAGHHPFTGVPWQERATDKLAPTQSGWDWIPVRCLDPDPAKRFQKAAEVAQALEPSRRLRWWIPAAAAVTLAAGVGAITYERATAPQESIRLAFLPLEASPETSALAQNVSQNAAEELTRLKGGKRARLKVIPLADVTRRHVDSAAKANSSVNATHVVRGKLSLENDRFVLHSFVTDARTQANSADWEFRYDTPEELRYASGALAGMTSAALRLPPIPVRAVNTSALQDYQDGLRLTRRNSTVDRALPSLERAAKADPDSPLTWAGLAQAQWFRYFTTRDPAWLQRTSESLSRAQSRDPDVALVHLVTGLLRENAGSYEQAEAEYLRAIEEDPAYSDAYRYLGQARYRSGRFDQALAPLEKARDLSPDYFKVYQELGNFYRRQGDRAQATRLFEKAVALAPEEAEMHFGLGTTYAEQYRLAEAERELRLAIGLSPSTPALNNLGFVLMERQKDRDAIPFLVQGTAGARDQYLALMNLGTAYRRIGDSAKSTQTYERSLELAEKEISRNPRDALVRSRLAFLCARLGKVTRAESEIIQALQLSPGDVNTRDMAVRVYETLNRRDDSIAMLRTSPDEVLLAARYWPDLADLHKDPRFKELLAQRGIK